MDGKSNSTGVNYLLEVTINEFDIITNISVNTNITLGCTDFSKVEDGSCIDVRCTDENACGFDLWQTQMMVLVITTLKSMYLQKTHCQ